MGSALAPIPLFLPLGETRATGKTPIKPAAPTPNTKGRSNPPTYTTKDMKPKSVAVATDGARILVLVRYKESPAVMDMTKTRIRAETSGLPAGDEGGSYVTENINSGSRSGSSKERVSRKIHLRCSTSRSPDETEPNPPSADPSAQRRDLCS